MYKISKKVNSYFLFNILLKIINFRLVNFYYAKNVERSLNIKLRLSYFVDKYKKNRMLSFFSRHSFSHAKPNPFQRVAAQVQAAGKLLTYYNIRALNDPRLNKLPFSIRILLESAVRNCD